MRETGREEAFIGANLLIFAAVMIFLLYGTKYLRHATPENLQKLGKPAAGVGALVLAGILFLRGHMEMGIALGRTARSSYVKETNDFGTANLLH